MTEFNYRKYMHFLEALDIEQIKDSQRYLAFLTVLVDYYNVQLLSPHQATMSADKRFWFAAGRAGSHVLGDVNTGRTLALEMFKIPGDYMDEQAMGRAERRYIDVMRLAIDSGVFGNMGEQKPLMQEMKLVAGMMRQKDTEYLENFVIWLKEYLGEL